MATMHTKTEIITFLKKACSKSQVTGNHSYTRPFSTYPSLNVYSLHKLPLTCYKSKLHTLRNPIMYNLPKFDSEKAAKNLNKTYKIQCFHH